MLMPALVWLAAVSGSACEPNDYPCQRHEAMYRAEQDIARKLCEWREPSGVPPSSCLPRADKAGSAH